MKRLARRWSQALPTFAKMLLPPHSRPQGLTAIATYQVPRGSHQLVGGEGEGLVAQVSIKNILENGTAVNKDRVSDSHNPRDSRSGANARGRKTTNDV